MNNLIKYSLILSIIIVILWIVSIVSTYLTKDAHAYMRCKQDFLNPEITRCTDQGGRTLYTVQDDPYDLGAKIYRDY